MKRFKPKTVKWCARVRVYGIDHTYEEKIIPPLVRDKPSTPICRPADCLRIG